ncbi:MAG: DUF4331 domain-containing protein [Actinomycetota bacterium]|nr:DUF4331 domain-containing protein [Actinomycetota bacterium]
MADHSDSPYPPTDITDLYAFQKPGDALKLILILNLNPDAPKQAAPFDPEASYELKIDVAGDGRSPPGGPRLARPGSTCQRRELLGRAGHSPRAP